MSQNDMANYLDPCSTCQRRGSKDGDPDACWDFVLCRTSKMPRRLNRRLGGRLVTYAGDGLVTSLAEFLGGEPLTQRSALVAQIMSAYPGMEAIVHDDACHMQRWFSEPHWHACRFPGFYQH